jgi:AraC family transcriptional regulator
MKPQKAVISRHSTGTDPRPHRHSDAYLALVLEGCYLETSVDGLWRCEPGDLVIHPPFHFHTNSFQGQTAVLNFHVAHSDAVKHNISEYAVVRPRHPDILLSHDADVAEVLATLGTAIPVEQDGLSGWVATMANELARDPGQRVADIAEKLSVSPEHASRHFGERVSMSPAAFRSECRFKSAFNLLRHSGETLSDIAHECGYSDQAHFSRHALSVSGLSPKKLRNFFTAHQVSSIPDLAIA